MESEKKITTLDVMPKFYSDHFEIMGQVISEADVPFNGAYLNFTITNDVPTFTYSASMDGTTVGQFVRHPVLRDQIFITNEVHYEDKGCRVIAAWWADGYIGNQITRITPALVVKNTSGEKFQIYPDQLNTLDAGQYTIMGFSTEFLLREDISFFLNKAPVTTTIDLSANSLYTISAGQTFDNTQVGVCDMSIFNVSDYCIATR